MKMCIETEDMKPWKNARTIMHRHLGARNYSAQEPLCGGAQGGRRGTQRIFKSGMEMGRLFKSEAGRKYPPFPTLSLILTRFPLRDQLLFPRLWKRWKQNRNPHHSLRTHESQRLTFLVHYVFGTILDGTCHLISSVFVATSEDGCYHHYPYFTGGKRGEQRLCNLPKITQDSGWSLQSSTPGSRIHCLTQCCTKGLGGRSYSHGVWAIEGGALSVED